MYKYKLMNRRFHPSIVDCGTKSKRNRHIYDKWATNYEKDIREWGYNLPEIVADIVVKVICPTDPCCTRIKILDCGAGDGLSGVALRKAGCLDETSTYIAGNDISPRMLDVANDRRCYDEIKVVDLNKKPLPYSDNEFDVVTCTGTMTYINPNSGVLDEYIRITKPGGLICYTNRTDKLKDWKEAELKLEDKGLWKLQDKVGPIPYLPLNKDYGEDIRVVILLYQVLDKPYDIAERRKVNRYLMSLDMK